MSWPQLSRPWLRRITQRLSPMLRQHAAALVGVDGDALELVVGHPAVQLRAIERVVRQPLLRGRPRPCRWWCGCASRSAPASTWPWIALWVTKPARLTACSVGRTGRPSMSTATRFEAVTSWYIRPKGLIRNTRSRPGHAQRDVVEDHLGPAEQVEHPVAGGQLHAGLPLGVGHRDGGSSRRGFSCIVSVMARLRRRSGGILARRRPSPEGVMSRPRRADRQCRA